MLPWQPRPPEVDWTLTQYDTALVRVRVPTAPGAAFEAAELILSTRCRRRRLTELPRPASADSADGRSSVAAIFEVPVALLHREGLRAEIRMGSLQTMLVWSDLVRVGPRPAGEFAPAPLMREAPPRRRKLRTVTDHAAPDAAVSRRRAVTPVSPSTRVNARAGAHGRPQPLIPAWPNVSAIRPRTDGAPPIAVERTLLQFLPYEEAAPRLAVPVSLDGDVLTVAVALPSVDLSVITDRSPWLRIEREVTGYHRIVEALREVEAMREKRSGGVPASTRARVSSPDGAPATAGVVQEHETGAADRAASSGQPGPRLRIPGIRRSRRILAGGGSRAVAARGAGLAPKLAALAGDRQRQTAAGAVVGIAATAALILMSSPPSVAEDPAARAALDTTACIGALVTAYLALACYRMRRSARSLALVLGLGAFAFTTVLMVAALGGPIALPRPEWAGGIMHVFVAATSTLALEVLGVAALVVGSAGLAIASRRTRDDLLAWCSIGALWLAVGHVAALLASTETSSWISAADLFRIAAVVCFLVGAAREIAAHGRQLASAAVEAERRRMARELHDGVAQELAYIVSQASSLARHERPEGPLQSIARAGERALIDSRRSILTLTSPQTSTLREAINAQASQWAKRAGLELEVQISDEVTTSPEMQHAILRIVQEAISNAVRHSGATKVMVSLSERDGNVTVRISDDGRGFDAQPRPEQIEHGFGLVSMAERAEAFGGQLRLQSEPGRGTVVEVAFR